MLCQSELCCDVLCWEDESFSDTNFLPKPNFHEMFWHGYRKSFSFLWISFVRSLHARKIQVNFVESDPAFYARTTDKMGHLQVALFTFVDSKPWESPQLCNCRESGTIQSHVVTLTARDLQQGHLISNKVIFPAVLPPSSFEEITDEIPACFISD